MSISLNMMWQEVVRHRVFVAVSFVVISLTVLIVGLYWPRVYSSYSAIYVEEQNILGPLMQGAAVQTEVTDRPNIARDIIYGRKIMMKVLEELGILETVTDPAMQEKIIEEIKSRTLITGRDNLIRIEYNDSDPETAYQVTKHLAELFIGESLADKARESQAAYEFIDQQVEEYKSKLTASEEGLKKFRSENIDARPGVVGEIGRRSSELNTLLEQVTQELNEARIRRASLVRQTTGEVETVSNFTRSEQNMTRIAELQNQLDALRLSYHETYPDIVRIKSQIEDLRQAVAKDEQDRHGAPGAAPASRIDERVLGNPVYQDLQRQLYDANTTVETLESRRAQTQKSLDDLVVRGKNVQEYEARLSELTRDYEVNKEIYTDLARRRESARVSMNLDREQKGLSLRIVEPAFYPHKPSGLHFLHFAIGAPIIGFLIPVGVLFGIRQVDPRVRTADIISQKLDIAVIGVIPHLATPYEARRESLGVLGLMLMMIAWGVLSLGIIVMRVQGQI